MPALRLLHVFIDPRSRRLEGVPPLPPGADLARVRTLGPSVIDRPRVRATTPHQALGRRLLTAEIQPLLIALRAVPAVLRLGPGRSRGATVGVVIVRR